MDATVVGLPDTGVLPLSMIVLPIAEAARLLDQPEGPTMTLVRFDNRHANAAVGKQVTEAIKPGAPARFFTSYWADLYSKLFGVLSAFRFLLMAMLSAILAIAAIFCYAVFEVLVVRRRRGMATLVALGLQPNSTRDVFHVLAIGIGALSAILGILGSILFVRSLDLLPLAAILGPLGLDRVPAAIHWWNAVILTALTIAFAWFSARLATRTLLRQDPAEEMRR